VSAGWDPTDIPAQDGRVAVVTGAGRGIGYFTAELLARAGATVVITTRRPEQAAAALASIRQHVAGARVSAVTLDLASLDSIRAAADALAAPIDLLINNGGLTSPTRTRSTTADGLERTVGTNAYGPFALTALLFPKLSADARVVWLGSLSTRLAKADPADLEQRVRSYNASLAYATSKHLDHAFAFELERRLEAAGSGIRSLLAHPGFALNAPSAKRPGITDLATPGQHIGERLLTPMTHGKDRGAWPVLRAATDPNARGGEFYGPSRSVTGRPVLTKPVAQSASPEFGAAAWSAAETATGVAFSV
jgi:NAD(P)-dependent dehydrogenase (short-subunit alcohol dehydrogenase family)